MLKRLFSSAGNEPLTMGKANAVCIEAELEWFTKVVETRFSLHFGQECGYEDVRAHLPPDFGNDGSEYARLVRECGMGFDERIVLMLALVPHIRPQALDTFFVSNKNFDRAFTEFGGTKGKVHGGFLPTCETASFILHGTDLGGRFDFIRMLEDDHFFAEKGILDIEHEASGEPMFSGALKLSGEYLNRLTTGRHLKPDYSTNFPAKRITTKLTWDDLVLTNEVLEEVENINAWLRHGKTIMEDWGLERTVKPGYRCLFYGPPGTGKTLTATLIGANAGLDVYRIDLSMVVSKYIGETEKNLAGIFDQAKNKNWILFFDEADSLFGKRTQTSSSNDRYANQEVSYLLQRVEDFPGVVILATNLKANIDEAFSRRFQSSIYFPLPDAEHRLQLWEGYFKGNCRLEDGVNLGELAEEYVLAGGAIANVVRYGAIRALQMGRNAISRDDLVKGIAKELIKEGKTI
ncbi:MAG TPA: ATP-binding protein [Gallionella sp.]|nr:ATP-binding protein [Gallionella sp.]